MSEETTTSEPNPEQQTLPTSEPDTTHANVPTNGDTPPATPEKDERDETIAEQAKRLAEYDAAEKKREEAKLSEQEKLAKQKRELDEREALQARSDAFLEVGLPRWMAAPDVDPKKIAKYLDTKEKDASKARNAGQNISPAGSGTSGNTEQPGDDAKKLEERYRNSSRWQRTSS